MSPRELSHALKRAKRDASYVVRVTNGTTEYPDLLLATSDERRARRTLVRRRKEGYTARLEINLPNV